MIIERFLRVSIFFLFFLAQPLIIIPLPLFWGYCQADDMDSEKYTIEFKACSIGEVLKKLSTKTGVPITISGETGSKTITKSYKQCTLDEILTHIFHNSDKAFVYYCSENKIDFLHIFIPAPDCRLYSGRSITGRNKSKINSNRTEKFNSQHRSLPDKPPAPPPQRGIEPPPSPPAMNFPGPSIRQ